MFSVQMNFLEYNGGIIMILAKKSRHRHYYSEAGVLYYPEVVSEVVLQIVILKFKLLWTIISFFCKI